MKSKGFSLLETLAGIVLITIAISFAFLILVQARKNTKMNQEFLLANQVSSMMSNYLFAHMQLPAHFALLDSFVGANESRVLDQTACNLIFEVEYCSLLFGLELNQKVYDDTIVVIRVYQKSNSMIVVSIDVIYYETKTASREVFLHE
jgi:prepilin-type N-terminal cleavage/methylation domain-containing protein